MRSSEFGRGRGADIARLKDAVVKVTAQTDGKTKVGTGFIVRIEKDAVFIVTASHVIEGDPQPKVVFRGKESKSFPAQVKGQKGGDPRGLAVLVVVGDVPQTVEALPASSDFEINGGEEVTVIGFPRTPAVPWAVTPGVVTGQEGEYLVFSGAAAEGNSGGPVLWNGKVVGVVTEVLSQYGYAVPIPILRLALRGWGVPLEDVPKEAKRLPEEKSAQDKLPRESSGKDSAPMVLIPAGEFWMGSTENQIEDLLAIQCGYARGSEQLRTICQRFPKAEGPLHRVNLDAYYMDKFEVTVARYAEFMRATNRANPYFWDQVDISKHRDFPVLWVDWHSALAYCEWVGKRLPTEAEWEKAARGTDGRIFPWGNEPPIGRFGNFGKWLTTNLDDPLYDGRTELVDSYEAGKSPYGLHHMAGNVYEWTQDWFDENYYKQSPEHNPKGPSSGRYRVIRGGSWQGSPIDVRSAARLEEDPSVGSAMIGFRCARDVK